MLSQMPTRHANSQLRRRERIELTAKLQDKKHDEQADDPQFTDVGCDSRLEVPAQHLNGGLQFSAQRIVYLEKMVESAELIVMGEQPGRVESEMKTKCWNCEITNEINQENSNREPTSEWDFT
jgi:ABC-type lipoprotein export system ATPase subunit